MVSRIGDDNDVHLIFHIWHVWIYCLFICPLPAPLEEEVEAVFQSAQYDCD